ncbi:hypothetical protein LOC71_10260 [Rhodopirellula sp. JC740]|uniref:Uncharacterized protein n=1 Tax=Rhodopirellula halodulae TaxID=2894198 RepID=A0ABS8NGI2_9BACT|nr:hypothetical protein [Rhodopirellula sp. JC740]MCC9642659.1 hypothetical protein [Rhodopirellula sp. JC740]
MSSQSFPSPSEDSSEGQPPPEKLSNFQIANPPDANQLAQFVTTIKNAEQQVGENIIGALRYPGCVAVLTTAVLGPDGQQRVVSMTLDEDRMAQVQEILQASVEEREDEQPCYGFHCLVKNKGGEAASDNATSDNTTSDNATSQNKTNDPS